MGRGGRKIKQQEWKEKVFRSHPHSKISKHRIRRKENVYRNRKEKNSEAKM